MVLEDDLTYRTEIGKIKQRIQFNRRTLLNCQSNAPGQQYLVWKTLCESHDVYRLLILSNYSKKPLAEVRRYYAESIIALLKLSSRTRHEDVLNETIGNPSLYLKRKLDLILEKEAMSSATVHF